MEVLWRLGLGWLVGRWLLLVTMPDHRAAVPFHFFAGTFYVRDTDAPWLDPVTAPAVTVQAWPGPRSVKVRPLDPDEEAFAAARWDGEANFIALSATGQRSPEMVAPDLVWVWPLVLAVWLLVRRLSRRT